MITDISRQLEDDPVRQLCAVFSQGQGEELAGTAGEYDFYILLELPLPWTPDPWKSPRLPEGLEALAAQKKVNGLKTRFLAVQPDPEYSKRKHTRIITYRRPAPLFSRYEKREYVVPSDELVTLLTTLLDKGSDAAELSSYIEHSDGVRDFLVCTHGSRDACCGKFGYSIYSLLRHVYAPRLVGQMRVWRVSHLGGHRFAPNLLDFPEGRYWGRLDEDSARTLLFHDRPPSDLRGNYRGWSGLDPLSQVAERDIFMREGWDWPLYSKFGQVLAEAREGAQVRIEYAAPNGKQGAYRATIEKSGVALMNTCLSEEPLREVNTYSVTSLEPEI